MLNVYILLVVIAACYAEMMPNYRKIEGAIPAEIEDFPYTVSVRYPQGSGRNHVSTGTILSNRWILTTASSVQNFLETPYAIHLLAGLTNTYTDTTNYIAIEMVLHPSYDPNKYDFDLALLMVERDIVFSERVASIGLFSEDSIAAGLSGSLVGYNVTYEGRYIYTTLYSLELKTTGTIDGMNLYATVTDDDVCFSDVGGAFEVDGKVVGISTVILGCGLLDNQYVTRFDTDTMEWINSVIA